jgi:hypothetical protein
MATRRQPTRPNPNRQPQGSAKFARWDQLPIQIAQWIALVLLVARPLFPSEDADAGSGLVLVALWGLVAVLWAAGQYLQSRICWYAAWIDLAPLLLFAAIVVSVIRCDTLRPAINMACEWAGLILSYLSIRQLFRSSISQRLLIAAMLGVAVTLSVYGLYQVFWGLDSMRADYARNRMTVLQDLEITPGSAQEEAFKNRLNSHEPFATFALANSLAGFLLAWLPLTLGWWFHPLLYGAHENAPDGSRGYEQTKAAVIHYVVGAIMVFSVFICLILTQSRTAYVGVCVQLVLLGALFGRTLILRLWNVVGGTKLAFAAVGAITLIAAVIAIAWQRGKIDEMLFTQSAKSFSYRLEYWQATLRMIAERPWNGTGPGNFRSHYLRYKLPQSSEEVIDPHNMVLEVVATSGLLAGAALVGIIAAATMRMFLRPGVAQLPSNSSIPIRLWLGGIAGFTVAAALWGGLEPWIYITLCGVWCCTSATVWWLGYLVIDSQVTAIAIVGVAIHLLGAGGISMPGVSQSIWALLAVGLNVSEGAVTPRQVGDRLWPRIVLLGVVGLWAIFVSLVLRPVVLSISSVSVGRNLLAKRDLGGAEARFRVAAEEDKLSAEPWLELSRIHYERWLSGRGQAADEQFGYAVAAGEQAHRLAPSRLEPIRRLAELYGVRAERSNGFWGKTAELYGRCIELYPNNAGLWVQLARAYWHDGQTEAAKQSAARALQLDAQTPHLDRKLTPAERKLLEPLQAHLAPVE